MSHKNIAMDNVANKYHQASLASLEKGETNDCTVKAVSIASGCSYDEAHKLMAEQGRKKGRGAHGWREALRKLGFRCVIENSITARTLATIMPMLENDKTYVIHSTRHVSAVVNGEFLDWAYMRQKHVDAVYQVVPYAKKVKLVTPAAHIMKERGKGWKIKPPVRGHGAKIWAFMEEEVGSGRAWFVNRETKPDLVDLVLEAFAGEITNVNNVKTEISCWAKYHRELGQ